MRNSWADEFDRQVLQVDEDRDQVARGQISGFRRPRLPSVPLW
jgi:hypothetical protein